MGAEEDKQMRTTTQVMVDGSARMQITRPQILVESGPQEGMEYFLGDRPTVLGRGEDTDIRLEDPSISRRHAEIQPRDTGWRILDLDSRSGTRLNGVPIESAELLPGTVIQLGKTELLFTTLDTTLRVDPHSEADFQGMLGESDATRRLFGMVRRVAKVDMPVLLQGESGTGKEGLARALHECRGPDAGPYVVVDTTLLDPEHLRSELFGHVKGAFTGADRDRKGAFERAQGGTLFLDEIGELPLDLQPMLLRALEQGEVRPLGGDRTVRVRARVVSATNRDLREMAREGTFREDLLYRLAAIQIPVPPLRERDDDCLLLARHFLIEGRRLSSSVADAIRSYPWPGNIRELKNVIQSACALSEGPELQASDLLLDRQAAARLEAPGATLGAAAPMPSAGVPGATGPGSLAAAKDQAEAQTLQEALRRFDGNRQAVAKHLGISRTTLWRRLKALGLD